MINVVAVQAEIEHRHRRLLQEAEDYRRAAAVAAGAGLHTPARRTPTGRVLGALVARHARRSRSESTADAHGSAARAA